MAKKTTAAFGSLAQGMQIGKMLNNNTDIAGSFMQGFSSGVQSSGVIEKKKAAQAKFDNIMQNFNSSVPTVTVEERSQLQPIVDGISKEAQDFAVAMVKDPNDLTAQANFNNSIAKINRITQAQTNKYTNNVNAARIHQNNLYSTGQDPTELDHAKQIVSNSATRTFDTDGYETYKMQDGTIYDNNPNTPNPPPPIVEEHFKAGHANVLKSWNSNVTVNNTYKKLGEQLEGYTVDGQANTIYQDLMTSGPDGSAPTYGNKMDILFGDISGDGQNVSFAEMFISGKLGEEYYKDLNGKELEYNGRPISSYPETTQPSSVDAIGDPSTAQKTPTNKAEALEAILRDKNSNDANLRNFSKFYANTIKTGLEQKRIKLGLNEGTVLLDYNGKPQFFADKNIANAAKEKEYVNQVLGKAITLDLNSADGDMDRVVRMFNSSNIPVERILVSKKGEPDRYGYAIGDPRKGTERIFEIDNKADMLEFKNVMANKADIFTNLPTLGGNPREWRDLSGNLIYSK